MLMFCNEISNKNTKMIFFFCIINYSLHARLKICRKITRARRLNERVVFAYFIVLIIFVYRFTCVSISIDFQNRFIYSVNSLICSAYQSFVWYSISRLIDHELIDAMSNELRNEFVNSKNEILRYEFYETWNQKISREKRRWQFVFDKKKHCFSDVFKIIVVETSNLKKKVMSWFQRRFFDLLFCQLVQN